MGTASDTAPGKIDNVDFQLSRSDGLYWNGSSWVSGLNWVATSAEDPDWEEWTAEADHWIENISYFVRSRAQDAAGNFKPEENIDTVELINDITPPDPKTTSPGPDEFLSKVTQIAGTATDVGVGVSTVTVLIKDETAGEYWHGTALKWRNAEPSSWPHANSLDWVYQGISDDDFGLSKSGHKFSVRVQAEDRATNVEVSDPSYFYYDRTPPKSEVEIPANPYYRELDIISGSARDLPEADLFNAGVDFVEISIVDLTADKYWSGLEWLELTGDPA